MGDLPLVVGIDLGGTHMQVGIVRPDGEIVHRRGTETHADRGPEGVIRHIADCVRGVCTEAEIPFESIGAVGVGAPGAIDPVAEVVLEAPNLGWKDLSLAERLRALLPGKRVVVENDVNAAIYGEARLGAARDERDVLGVWVGTGIGGGLVIGGSLYRGSMGTAGEIGNTILFPDAQTAELRRMENHCSRKSVIRRIINAVEQGELSTVADLVYGDVHSITAMHVAEAYREEDQVVTRIVNRGAELLGMSIANVVSVLGIRLVVMGGGMTEAMGQVWVDRVAESVRRYVFPKAVGGKVELRITALRENAGLLGAAMLAGESDGAT